ncbi:hypothetical protein H1C71_032732, partial [Ictidomys tridecemlineatus]
VSCPLTGVQRRWKALDARSHLSQLPDAEQAGDGEPTRAPGVQPAGDQGRGQLFLPSGPGSIGPLPGWAASGSSTPAELSLLGQQRHMEQTPPVGQECSIDTEHWDLIAAGLGLIPLAQAITRRANALGAKNG